MRSSLGDLRSAIASINTEVMLESGQGVAINADVLKRLKTTRPLLVEEFTPELVNSALVKLINDVCARKGVKTLHGEANLFGEYRGIKSAVTLTTNEKKATSQLTLAEADAYLNGHNVKVEADKNADLRRLVDDCRPYFRSESDTLETAQRRRREETQPEFL